MKKLKWLNTGAFAVMVIVNILAVVPPFGGKSANDTLFLDSNLLAPAPVTFVIWGIIYTLLTAFLLYQWGLVDDESDALVEKIGLWFVVGCIFNVAWIVGRYLDLLWLSFPAIVGLYVTLFVVENALKTVEGAPLARMCAKGGFHLYFGWVTIAVLAGAASLLKGLGWNGFGLPAEFWAVIGLFVGAAAGTYFIALKHNVVAGTAVIWGYIGIIVNHLSKSGWDGRYPAAATAAILGMAVMIAAYSITVYKRWFLPSEVKAG